MFSTIDRSPFTDQFEPRIPLLVPLVNSLHTRFALIADSRGQSAEELAGEILWIWTTAVAGNDAGSAEISKPDKAPCQYHTTREIRDLIREALPDLIDWFGDSEFAISTLRDFLSRRITFRPGDKEIVSKVPRWESQVSNAIDIKHWPECPIVPSRRRRQYRIAQIHLDARANSEGLT